jgi:hypothetical protein
MTSRHESVRTESGAATTIDSRRREVSQEQGALSEDYNAKVQVGKVSPNHTGNKQCGTPLAHRPTTAPSWVRPREGRASASGI